MKLYLVSPPSIFREVEPLADGIMALAPDVLRDEDYALLLKHLSKKRGKERLMLDNGAFEFGTSEAKEKLLSAMAKIEPGAMVLPDKIGDAETSYEMQVGFLEWISASQLPPAVIAPLQGTTTRMCLEQANRLMRRKRSTSISHWGIPFINLPQNFRLGLAKTLKKETGLKSHFLGISKATDMECLSGHEPFVESMDTGYPVHCGMVGVTFKDKKLPYPEVKDRPMHPTSLYYMECISKNVETILDNIS